MRRILLPALLALSACGFRHEAVLSTTINQAERLESTCVRRNLSSPEVVVGRKLLVEARKQRDAGEGEAAYLAAELSLLQMQLGMANAELEAARKSDTELQKLLDADRQETAAYEKLLADVKAKRGLK